MQSLEERKLKQKAYYEANKVKRTAQSRAWRDANRSRWMQTRREHRKRLRDLVLAKYNSRCNSCGFDNPKALQIDHIQNDGMVDRQRWKGAPPAYLRAILADDGSRYQLLCANCNSIKYWGNPGPKHRGFRSHQAVETPASMSESNQTKGN